MASFATYLHPHTCHTSKPTAQIQFVGHSQPHFERVRAALASKLAHLPSIPPQKATLQDYRPVHHQRYLDKLSRMAADELIRDPPRLSAECSGFEYCLPGYLYGLGGMLSAIDRMKKGSLERAYTFSLGGHHAYADWGYGYCLLNPQAAAARYAQRNGY